MKVILDILIFLGFQILSESVMLVKILLYPLGKKRLSQGTKASTVSSKDRTIKYRCLNRHVREVMLPGGSGRLLSS